MEDDDVPQLSAGTFTALVEFYKEQNERENRLKLVNSETSLNEDLNFDENWQLSQFWYDEKTVDVLIKVALKKCGC
ncbi:hypothetical protein NQ317_007343 [Molorchus minor]|uniref:Uncharacterized protein n=1 Tax=Molorchus minor TaxID=1323400 RepID=A0ABQ9IYM7_9CUCU|nr:hypothetical protein NQ317_007343 [Molorchus minor]